MREWIFGQRRAWTEKQGANSPEAENENWRAAKIWPGKLFGKVEVAQNA
jgi:hypothetical protein